MEVQHRKKSSLMTPDPYHTPRYGGYCPQFKYRYGETFGKMTAKLLTDGEVASSGNLVLARIHPEDEMAVSGKLRAANETLLNRRKQSWGDQKLLKTMIPGYTGFIPRSQHFFHNRYTENSFNAICDFEREQLKSAERRQDLEKYIYKTGEPLPIMSKYVTPLKPVSKSMAPYISKSTPPPNVSPFSMDNKDPRKRFISGYTGFVPRSRGRLGAGYPFITHNALQEFTTATEEYKKLNGEPIRIHRPEPPVPETPALYLPDSGLVPHYTGHIPGQKFRYGNTFGHSTCGVTRSPKTITT